VNDLATLGAPAADALPEELRRQIALIVAPRIWSVVYTWDDPGRGPGTTARSFLTQASAQREAAERALGIVREITEDVTLDPGDDEDRDILDSVAAARAALQAGSWGTAWGAAETALAGLTALGVNDGGHDLRIDWQHGLSF
jgi:hypothetical protein